MLVLVSCSGQLSKGDVYGILGLQKGLQNEYSRGEEFLSEIKESVEDKSMPFKQDKAKIVLNSVLFVDSVIADCINEISNLKILMLKDVNYSIKEKSKLILFDRSLERKCRPLEIDFSQTLNDGKTNRLINVKVGLSPKIKALRHKFCNEVVNLRNKIRDEDEKPYFFKDPKVNNLLRVEDLSEILDSAISESNLILDDQFKIKELYMMLSNAERDLNDICTTYPRWKDAMASLMALEMKIIQSRTFYLFNIRYEAACCGPYVFDKIQTVVEGPNVGFSGDTIRMKISMMAYETTNQPIIKCPKNVVVEQVKGGFAYLYTIIPDGEELDLKGVVSKVNRSGVEKTLPWSHKVKILPKPVQK